MSGTSTHSKGTVSAYHHVALRVSDIERSSRFYLDALGGHLLTAQMLYEGPDAAVIMGTPDARFKVCLIGFDEGAIELFEFLAPVHPVRPGGQFSDALMHFAFRVDSVPDALRRVEAAGGKRFWPEIRDMPGGFQVVYATDPDGHVFELIDIGAQELIRRLIDADPSNAPPS